MVKFVVVNAEQSQTEEPTYFVRAISGDEAVGLITLQISETEDFEDSNFLASLKVNRDGNLFLVLHTGVSSEYPVDTHSNDSIVAVEEGDVAVEDGDKY